MRPRHRDWPLLKQPSRVNVTGPRLIADATQPQKILQVLHIRAEHHAEKESSMPSRTFTTIAKPSRGGGGGASQTSPITDFRTTATFAPQFVAVSRTI